MAAQPARSASEQISGAAQTHPQYFKAGTIERIYDDVGSADGRRLPFQSKAIAAFLILKAQKNRGYTCVMPEREICATLGIDGKTFRKYLSPLVEAKLVHIDKSRRDATRCFDCKPLFNRYAEEQSAAEKVTDLARRGAEDGLGKVSQTAATLSLRETALSARETFALASGNDPTSARESIPNPINPSYFLISTSDLNAVFENRFGNAMPPGCERHIRVSLHGFDAFGMTERRQRALFKRYGIYAVSDAIAYVLNQLTYSKVENPAGFVCFALEKGLRGDTDVAFADLSTRFGKLSQSDETPESGNDAQARPGIVSQSAVHEDHVAGDLWQAALSYLETRLSTAEMHMLVRPSKPITLDDGVLTIAVGSSWVRDRFIERCSEAITTALETLIGPPIALNVIVSAGDVGQTVP